MGRRKRRKLSSTLTWKATKGFVRLVFQGILKVSPLLGVGAIGFGIFWGIREELYADPGFLVQKIEVLPEGTLSPAALRELEKFYLNRNLLKISPPEVQRWLEKDPEIQEARVIRELPKTLRIEARKRIPSVQIERGPPGPYYSAAEDGVVLGQDFQRNKNLLFVEIFEAEGWKPEIGKKLPVPGLAEGIALARAFVRHPLGRLEKVERIRLDHLGNVSLVLSQGPELRFGREPLKQLNRFSLLEPLLKGSDRSRIVYVDLQYQDLIVKKR